MNTLSAISIRQPWLDMIVREVKSIELRTWELRERGTIALHAPRRIDFSAAYLYGYSEPWLLPTGKIVALADVADVMVLDRQSWCENLIGHRQPIPTGGTYAIKLGNVRTLKRPLAYRGHQMIFPLSEEITKRVLKALSETD